MGYQPKSAIRRRRIKHEASFEMRLAKAARQAREAAPWWRVVLGTIDPTTWLRAR
jgi:hypothetical protein